MAARRVVTGTDPDNKSSVVHDGPTTGSLDLGRIILDDIWIDDPNEPDPEARRDPVEGPLSLEGPPGGSVVRLVTFRPATASDRPSDEAIAAAAQRWNTGKTMEDGNEGWHTTATIDYGIVLSGQIELRLDSGNVRLAPGDVVVQRRTRHAWRVIGDEPCQMAFVLISSPNYA